MKVDPKPVAPERYTSEYYEHCCDGYEEFSLTHGDGLPARLAFSLQLAGLKPGMKVLDVGCGRGEVGRQCVQAAATWCGIDYAPESLKLAGVVRRNLEDGQRLKYWLARASAIALPFQGHSFDRVFMLDVVEHLTCTELSTSLGEIRRVLSPEGQLVIHTAPSLWYYRYGYPLYRLLQGLRRKRLPANPRERWAYNDVHINEQTSLTLGRTLRAHGFRAKVWLTSTQNYAQEPNTMIRFAMHFVSRVFPFKLVFADEIMAIGTPCAS